VVHRLAEGRPVVLVVDDVHLAGPTTLAWLRMAGRRGRRLLVVATRRTGEGGELQPDRVITLGPLGEPATRQLVGAERARALYERSGGHPLFLVELAAADPGEDLPASIRDWAAARAEALGPAASTVTTAAVLGPDVDLDLLAQVMQLPAAVVLDHLETAVRGRLLEARANGFAFRHELVREALASVPAGARTAQLHREAARALSARPRQDPLAVAWHARLAGDASMAASALMAAADLAYGRADVAEAERLLDEAVTLEDGAPVRVRRSRMRMLRGDLNGADQDAAKALDLDPGPETLELTGWIAYYRRDFPTAQRFAEEGARRAVDLEMTASCLALAGRIRHSAGELADADIRLTEAVRRFPSGGAGVAGTWLGWLRAHQGRPLEALELADVSLLDPDRQSRPFARSHGLAVRAYGLAMRGRSADALDTVNQLDRLIEAREQLYRRYRGMAANFRAWVLRQTGRDREADEWNERALAWSAAADFTELRGHALLDLADSRLLFGRLDDASSLLRSAAEAYSAGDATMSWHQRQRALLVQARLHLVADEPDSAAAAADVAVQDSAERGARRHELIGQALLARALAALGDRLELEEVDAVLNELEGMAALEVWWLTADLAAAAGVERWWRDAERRLATVVAGAADRGGEVAAWGRARLDALGAAQR
jgi:tetratricopeptide (TPR) repeat protein